MYPGNHMQLFLWLLEAQDEKEIAKAEKQVLQKIVINNKIFLSCLWASNIPTNWINKLLI